MKTPNWAILQSRDRGLRLPWSRCFLSCLLLCYFVVSGWSQVFPIPESSFEEALGKRPGAMVMVDCAGGEMSVYHADNANLALPPCSTFKIWNTLIGLELGILKSPDEAFYQWDGEARFIQDWNKDLKLREAFQVSCVPAFQNLAKKIGEINMTQWLGKLDYGNQDMSAGLEVFWLPAPERTTLRISAIEQVEMLRRLVNGSLPVSQKSVATIKEIMLLDQSKSGNFYGKTGTGKIQEGDGSVGWFVGFVESGNKTYAFACLGLWQGATGKEAREITEKFLLSNGYR